MQNRAHQFRTLRLRERAAARGQLVKHSAGTVDVGARVHIQPAQLFRRHVRHGAGNCPALHGDAARHVGGHVVVDKLGQAKIENFQAARGGDHQVGWLEVPMNYALLVCGRQAFRELQAQTNGLRFE